MNKFILLTILILSSLLFTSCDDLFTSEIEEVKEKIEIVSDDSEMKKVADDLSENWDVDLLRSDEKDDDIDVKIIDEVVENKEWESVLSKVVEKTIEVSEKGSEKDLKEISGEKISDLDVCSKIWNTDKKESCINDVITKEAIEKESVSWWFRRPHELTNGRPDNNI